MANQAKGRHTPGGDQAMGVADSITRHTGGFPPYFRLQALDEVERRSFLLTQAEVHKEPDRTVITSPATPLVATARDERKFLESPRNPDTPIEEELWRWPAGGVLPVLRDQHQPEDLRCALVKKDGDAPTYAGHLTFGAGLGASKVEFLYANRTALREGCEEIIIATHRWVGFPWFAADEFGGINLDMWRLARNNSEIARSFIRPAPRELTPLPAKFIPLAGAETVEIRWSRLCVELSGMLHFDHSCSAIDFVTAIEVELSCDLEDLILIDGEVDPEGKALDREIWLHKLSRRSDWSLELGENVCRFKTADRLRPYKGPLPPRIPYVDRVL